MSYTLRSVSLVIICLAFGGCNSYLETFEGKAPKACSVIGATDKVTPDRRDIFSLRVCEGYGLYSEKVGSGKDTLTMYEEIPIRRYYNYDNPDKCRDCRLVEETYFILEGIHDKKNGCGTAVFMPSHRTFNHNEVAGFDSTSHRSGDIRQYYTDEKKELNLGVVFEVMKGKWCRLDDAKLQIDVPNESDAGYYTIYAEYAPATGSIVLKTITDPTIHKYSGAKSGPELAIDINTAIRYENEPYGLTFHKVAAARNLVADFNILTPDLKHIQKLYNRKVKHADNGKRVFKLERKIRIRERKVLAIMDVLDSLQKSDAAEFTRLSAPGMTLPESVARDFGYMNWISAPFNIKKPLVKEMVFGKNVDGRKVENYLRVYCEGVLDGGAYNDELSMMKKCDRKKEVKRLLARNKTDVNLNSYIRFICKAPQQHSHQHYFKKTKSIFTLDDEKNFLSQTPLISEWNIVQSTLPRWQKEYSKGRLAFTPHMDSYHPGAMDCRMDYVNGKGKNKQINARVWPAYSDGHDWIWRVTWIGSGHRFRWRVVLFDEEEKWAVFYFPSIGFSRAGIHIVTKKGTTLTAQQLEKIKDQLRADPVYEQYVPMLSAVRE